MGYTTDFYGEFDITPALKPEHRAYLAQFAEIRHMRRDNAKLEGKPDPLREAVGLPLGVEGEFYVGTKDKLASQEWHDESVLDGNREASTQPGLWCQWVPSDDGTALVWDEGEKFYEYEAWLDYLIENFLKPWGYTVSGEVEWQGEDRDDAGLLVVENNVVSAKTAERVYE